MASTWLFRIDVNNESTDDIGVDYFDYDDLITMIDHEDKVVEFSRSSAIAAARAILAHFNEVE